MLNIFFVLTHSFPPEQCSALNKNSLLGMDSLKKKKKKMVLFQNFLTAAWIFFEIFWDELPL